jgi:hypothetical protein
MKKILLIIMCLCLATPVGAVLTLNPTVPVASDRWLDLTLDASTAFDLGFARTINYAIYRPAAAGNEIFIRAGSSTAPRIGGGKSVDGSWTIIYITGSVRPYIKANECNSGDILMFSFK